jgi:hypothetical protein
MSSVLSSFLVKVTPLERTAPDLNLQVSRIDKLLPLSCLLSMVMVHIAARIGDVLRRDFDQCKLLLAAVAATDLVLRERPFDRKIALGERAIPDHRQGGADRPCRGAAASPADRN